MIFLKKKRKQSWIAQQVEKPAHEHLNSVWEDNRQAVSWPTHTHTLCHTLTETNKYSVNNK